MPAPHDVDRLCEQLAFQSRVLTAVLCKLDALCCCLQERAAPAAGAKALPPVPAAAPIAFHPQASPGFLAAAAVGRPTLNRTSFTLPALATLKIIDADPGRTFLAFGTPSTIQQWFDITSDVMGGPPAMTTLPPTQRLEFSRDTSGGLAGAEWWVRDTSGSPVVITIWASVG